MVACPKCGYIRQPEDEDFFPATECPKCGIVYEKFEKEHKELDSARMVVYIEKPGANRAYLWILAALVLVAGVYIATSKGVNKPVSPEATKRTLAPAQSRQRTYPQPTAEFHSNTDHPAVYTVNPQAGQQQPPNAPNASHATPPVSVPLAYDAREVLETIHRISETFNQPMDSSYYYKNDLDTSDWDSIKSLPTYTRIRYILYNYHLQHTYVGNQFFVCVDMAMDVWDLLETAGIRARLMVGNVQTDITQADTVARYIATMNHAWVLVRVERSTWIPVETTGGFIPQPQQWNFGLYNEGEMFENPGEFKDFVQSRMSMFKTCRQIGPMQAAFNQSYAGKPVNGQGAEFTGRIMQKVSDCRDLVAKVQRFLQH
ncbi:MAG: hypothetical protein ACP5IL_11345 [Syntrophobacteraceae bacterium]